MTAQTKRELRYTIHTGHGRILETLVPLARAVEVVGQFAMPAQRRRRELETIKLRAGELTTVEGIVVRCFELEEEQPDTFTHTGLLMVRVHASNAEEARELLAKAASAALEADPFIRRVEGTSVTRNPAPKRRK